MKKLLISLLFCFSIPMWSGGFLVKYGDLYYTLEGNYASVTMDIDGYSSTYTKNEYIVPSEITYDGLKYVVNRLDPYCFSTNWADGGIGSTASYISLPNTIIGIGMGAFRNCKNLTSLVIPESVK